MSWITLPTDYQDVTWEGMRKYVLVDNGDDTVSFRDVTTYINNENAQMTASILNQITSGLNNIMTGLNVASAFSTSQSYAIGDYCFYDGLLYKFVAAHQGTWSNVHATVVVITDEIKNKLTDAPSDGNEYVRKNGAWAVSSGGGGSGSAAWGQITGTLSNQTDLQAVLDGKSDISAIADEWVSGQGYVTGALMTHAGKLYKAVQDFLTSEWSANYVQEISVSDLLAEKANTADLGDLASQDTVDYADVIGKPSTFPPSSHTHDDRYYTETEVDSLLSGKQGTLTFDSAPVSGSNNPVKSGGIYTALSAKANTADLGNLASKDSVDYETEVTNKPTLGTMAVVNDAPSNGNEYVRKNGAWQVSSGGGGTVVSAVWGDITGTLSSQTDLQTALNAKANAADLGDLADHDTVDYATEVTGKPSTFPPSAHTHDDRYYTESEIDTLLSAKQGTLTFDTTPASGSTNPVTSGGIATALAAKANTADLGGIQVRPNYRIEPDTTSTIEVGDPLPTGTIVFIYEAS